MEKSFGAHGRRKHQPRTVAVFGILFALLAPGAELQADSAVRHGSLERITVHGMSLEGNLEGDSPDREVSVYLPPGYRTSGHGSAKLRRYPVVYLLHGFTDSDLRWFGPDPLFNGAAAADRAFSDGVAGMIVVMPNAKTRYFGSMYSNSPTTGDWETFVARDLVNYIDQHYRTIPDRMSRGLAGHSMGGYGTVRIGMKFPEIFSSIYAMSACCLEPANLQDAAWANIPDIDTDEELAQAGFLAKAQFASAAAWSSNPDNPPRYLDLPRKGGEFQPAVAAKWAANAPVVMLDRYASNLMRLHAMALDVGSHDSLINGVQAFDRALTEHGVAHRIETYDGDHLNRIEMRFERNVLPFFAHNLRFAGRGRER